MIRRGRAVSNRTQNEHQPNFGCGEASGFWTSFSIPLAAIRGQGGGGISAEHPSQRPQKCYLSPTPTDFVFTTARPSLPPPPARLRVHPGRGDIRLLSFPLRPSRAPQKVVVPPTEILFTTFPSPPPLGWGYVLRGGYLPPFPPHAPIRGAKGKRVGNARWNAPKSARPFYRTPGCSRRLKFLFAKSRKKEKICVF